MTEKLAVELVGDMLSRHECDVLQHLAIPMPIPMIAQILGVLNATSTTSGGGRRTVCASWTSHPLGVAWPEQ